MSDGEVPADDGRDESEMERIDRELIELLNEIRVALPGVQLLFAFLLAVPFQQRFTTVGAFGRDVYFVAVCLSLAATALLMAPTAFHRLNFRAANKQRLVMQSNWLALAGMAALAGSLTAVMLLVADQLFSTWHAWLVAAATAAVFTGMWVVLPLLERMRGGRAR